jgi:hypothetical protein
MKHLFKISCVALLCVGAAACSPKYSGKPLSELTYSNVDPAFVSAANVQVNNIASSIDPLDVAASLPTRPDRAVENWLRSRYKPMNGVGDMIFTVEDATVRVKAVEAEKEFQRRLKTGSSKQYDAEVKISFEKLSDTKMNSSRHSVKVGRTVVIPDSWAIARREEALQEMIDTLVKELDAGLFETLMKEQLVARPPYVNYQTNSTTTLFAPEVAGE